jgi:ribonuclease E
MANKMLIDATHPEETRVVVVRGQRIEEFDFEAADRKPLRGNIYLAKVTRVEPSLQAAFIEYGGNRHGFLAFSEIHPDYYQIPVADREALIADERRAEQDAEEGHERSKERSERSGERSGRRSRRPRNAPKSAPRDETVSDEAVAESTENEGSTELHDQEAVAENGIDETLSLQDEADTHGDDAVEDEAEGTDSEAHEAPQQLGGDAHDDMPERPRVTRRHYKIQEVIKRRQILLVQVVKEERGSKGAALTTYLSLAGRYSVLMPNTGKGGGISRKITSGEDRKRLKEIVQDLDVPEGMGVILRTAGASRTKPEIKRDYEYLMRMWEQVREMTMSSSAPALVYEEGSLVRRAIRDLYNKDIDEVQVAGETAYRDAKDFMKLLMPSHAKNVQAWREPQPLFARYGVESQLDAMFSSTVTLKSGGYIVINQTEALVAIDINSGRSTREHNIEDTALKTNLEAAEEIARQLRLRDLAGLIVIDFIDMDENRNNRAVEKRISECLKNDRARIQLCRISGFGLLEMSRQRIRTGVLESSSLPCPHCSGTGLVRANPSVALQILRALEEALIRNNGNHMSVKTRSSIALYVLNHKRGHLRDLEIRFGVTITVSVDDHLTGANYYVVERGEAVTPEARALLTASRVPESARAAMVAEEIESDEVRDEAEEDEGDGLEAEGEGPRADSQERGQERGRGRHEENGEGEGGRKRRRRRRRRGRGGEDRPFPANGEASGQAMEGDEPGMAADDGEDGDESMEARPQAGSGERGDGERGDGERDGRRRRGRRGGRRNRGERGEGRFGNETNEGGQAMGSTEAEGDDADGMTAVPDAAMAPEPARDEQAAADEPVAKPRRGRKSKIVAEDDTAQADAAPAEPAEKPKRSRAKAKPAAEPAEAVAEAALEVAAPAAEPQPEPVMARAPEPEPVAIVLTPPDPDRPKRGGWWRRG